MDPVLDALRVLALPPSWLTTAADGPQLADRLVRTVPELNDEGSRLRACSVEDLRLKGSRWVGRYLLTVAGPDGVRDLVLTGVLDPDGPAAAPLRSDVAFGHDDWSVSLSDPPLTLSPADADRKLAALPLLTDPATAREWLERNLQEAFPGIRIASCDPVVVRYRPGQRCTVICRLTFGEGADPGWPQIVVAKVHRSGEGAHAYGALEALASAKIAETSGLVFAAPLAYLPSSDVSLQGNLPEDRSLTDLLVRAGAGSEDATTEAEAALRRVADALVALHDAPVHYGPALGIDDEIVSVRRAGTRLGAALPDLRDAAEPLLELIEERMAAAPGRPGEAVARRVPAGPGATRRRTGRTARPRRILRLRAGPGCGAVRREAAAGRAGPPVRDRRAGRPDGGRGPARRGLPRPVPPSGARVAGPGGALGEPRPGQGAAAVVVAGPARADRPDPGLARGSGGGTPAAGAGLGVSSRAGSLPGL